MVTYTNQLEASLDECVGVPERITISIIIASQEIFSAFRVGEKLEWLIDVPQQIIR